MTNPTRLFTSISKFRSASSPFQSLTIRTVLHPPAFPTHNRVCCDLPSCIYQSRDYSRTSFPTPRPFRITFLQSHPTSLPRLGNSVCSNPSRYQTRAKWGNRKDSIHTFSPRQGGFGSWTGLAIAGLITAVCLYSISTFEGQAPDDRPAERTEEVSSKPNKMTGETLPGRPGTLTAEQEEKLKEFWRATLQVYGVLETSDASASPATPTNGDVETKKPKKKRFSLLRSKPKEEDVSQESNGDHEDKYGQTKEFHEALASMSPEVLRDTAWTMLKHDHPDALLLRFLRARKWNVENALVMMVSTMRWRLQDMHVEQDIVKNGELSALEESQSSDSAKKKFGQDFMEQLRLGKSFLHGLDRHNRPMCVVRVRLHKQGEQSEESLERYTVYVIETARMLLAPPVDTACVVFDMTGFSMANMDYTPLKFMIKCFEANYPESLGAVIVHKAPWIFQGLWKVIRGWLDPVVASKISFTNNAQEMEEFVEDSKIMKELGGSEDWVYKYAEPVPGENDVMKDTVTRDKLLAERKQMTLDFEKATLDWVQSHGNAEEIKTRRNELATNLRENYWILDPYVRARTHYDRIGMLNPGGKVDFYPAKTNVPQPTTNADNDLD